MLYFCCSYTRDFRAPLIRLGDGSLLRMITHKACFPTVLVDLRELPFFLLKEMLETGNTSKIFLTDHVYMEGVCVCLRLDRYTIRIDGARKHPNTRTAESAHFEET